MAPEGLTGLAFAILIAGVATEFFGLVVLVAADLTPGETFAMIAAMLIVGMCMGFVWQASLTPP